MKLRKCLSCGVEKPHDTEHFYAHAGMTSGLLNRCKPCHVAISKKNKAARPEETKAADHGRYLRKAETVRENSRRWRRDNADRLAESNAAYRERTRDSKRLKDRNYAAANPVAFRERAKAWRILNPERANAASRAKRRAKPDLYRAISRDGARRRRVAKLGAQGTHTRAEFLNLLIRSGSRCAYCCSDLDSATATEDHVTPLSRGGVDGIENILPACLPCNVRKNNRPVAQFLLRERRA